jgi:hypothetical protein
MGEYLSKPERTKTTESGEAQNVTERFNLLSYDSWPLACRGGVGPWRTPTSQTLIWVVAAHFSEFLTGMAVSNNKSDLLRFRVVSKHF